MQIKKGFGLIISSIHRLKLSFQCVSLKKRKIFSIARVRGGKQPASMSQLLKHLIGSIQGLMIDDPMVRLHHALATVASIQQRKPLDAV